MSVFDSPDIISHIFSNDPHAVWKYERTRGRTSCLASDPGLRKLMMALLKDGIECYQAYFLKASRRNERQFCEAEEWVTSEDTVYPLHSITCVKA